MARIIAVMLLITAPFVTCISERTSCVACNPSNVKSVTPPSIGPDMATMYADLIQSVLGIHWQSKKASIPQRDGTGSLCCAIGTQCVMMVGLGIPFCYDKFTLNFYLPDKSNGNLHTGEYTDSNGKAVNLITGDIDGGGNIYSNSPGEKPNTSTMDVPPQFTASGVGSAIPIGSLGDADLTATAYDFVGKSTRDAITIEATTISPTTVNGIVVPETTMDGTTIPATTIVGSGIATVSPKKGEASDYSASSLLQICLVLIITWFGPFSYIISGSY